MASARSLSCRTAPQLFGGLLVVKIIERLRMCRSFTTWYRTLFDDVLLAQSAVDRFKNAAYDFVIEGESYRPRLKPTLDAASPPPASPTNKVHPHPRSRRR